MNKKMNAFNVIKIAKVVNLRNLIVLVSIVVH